MTVTNSLCSPFIVRKFSFGHYIFWCSESGQISDLERKYESYLLIKMGFF